MDFFETSFVGRIYQMQADGNNLSVEHIGEYTYWYPANCGVNNEEIARMILGDSTLTSQPEKFGRVSVTFNEKGDDTDAEDTVVEIKGRYYSWGGQVKSIGQWIDHASLMASYEKAGGESWPLIAEYRRHQRAIVWNIPTSAKIWRVLAVNHPGEEYPQDAAMLLKTVELPYGSTESVIASYLKEGYVIEARGWFWQNSHGKWLKDPELSWAIGRCEVKTPVERDEIPEGATMFWKAW